MPWKENFVMIQINKQMESLALVNSPEIYGECSGEEMVLLLAKDKSFKCEWKTLLLIIQTQRLLVCQMKGYLLIRVCQSLRTSREQNGKENWSTHRNRNTKYR